MAEDTLHPSQEDNVIDSAVYDFPLPHMNNAALIQDDSPMLDVNCPFKYRSLQELLTSTAICAALYSYSTIVLHNDGGANCFIFNDHKLFWAMIPSTLSVIKLDGSSIKAAGSGVVVIRPPGGSQLLVLGPSYNYHSAPQHTLSPNAKNNYLQIP
jgi:hypothetical protein